MKTFRPFLPLLLVSPLLAMALVVTAQSAATPRAHAAVGESVGGLGAPSVDRQVVGEPSGGSEDTKVAVQVWTIMAAGIACAGFLLLFLLRVGLGRGPKAPPQEDAHH